MNIKKSFLAALACVTAFTSVSAFAVSAATLGDSDGNNGATAEVTVKKGEETKADVKLDNGENVQVILPADALEEGTITVHVVETEEKDLDKIKTDNKFKSAKVLDLYFTSADGTKLSSDKEAVMAVDGTKYDAVYILNDDGTVTEVPSVIEDGVLTFKVPVLAEGQKIVVAEKEPIEPSQTSQTSQTSTTSQPSNNNNGTGTNTNNNTNNGNTNNGSSNTSNTSNNGSSAQTGDNGFKTTVAVFAVMAVVALGTAVAAAKSKKSAK